MQTGGTSLLFSYKSPVIYKIESHSPAFIQVNQWCRSNDKTFPIQAVWHNSLGRVRSELRRNVGRAENMLILH